MTPIELLAPAKNLEAGKLAIQCGADAVYIGASAFGARSSAGNSLPEIEALIRYAHSYRAKVYATLNTLLYDNEIAAAKKLARSLCDIDIDALIIQDMAYLQMDLPPVSLFASTQMHNNSVVKVTFLESAGFERAILARELSLKEISAIRQQTHIPLEVFVHGAICVSYSGQCFLSRAGGPRSGNRGDCAQPCRGLFSLQTERGQTLVDNKHLLSLKDLNQSAHLEALLDAGVTSFKIEGRLKDELYLKNVVLYYRQQLDRILADRSKNHGITRASSGKVESDFTSNLDKTFNRGYCDYFITGQPKEITAWDSPKWQGEPIGVVQRVDAAGIVFESTTQPPTTLAPGDGIAFLDSSHELTGTVVNAVNDLCIQVDNPAGINAGTHLCRNRDHLYLKRLQAANPRRKISVNLTLLPLEDGYQLTAVDEDGVTATQVQKVQPNPAKNLQKLMTSFEVQLTKSGDTPFAVEKVTVASNTDAPFRFIPISGINALRRDTLQALATSRAKQVWKDKLSETDKITHSSACPPLPTETSYSTRSTENALGRFDNDELNVTNELARLFYEEHGVRVPPIALESRQLVSGDRVMVCRYCILHELGKCLNHTPSDETYVLVDARGRRYRLHFDCARCRMEVYLA